ncbi:MAG: signal peptidase I, partial [Muribaculaceae bacterium]|nr:signal peptidase I [Muribaculaceae bacterium]
MDNVQNKVSSGDDFRRRISQTKTTRWVRFALVSLIFLAWVAWMGQWWLAVFELLLFDIYITGYIPFTWWKKSSSPMVRTLMSWVDAIVYALVLVYFVFAFVGQNYQIPSSSLEKTLLTGDYLWVNKMIYGPRVPMTPVHFPLVHNELFGHKSYLDKPSVEYRRLKGFRNVEEGDIVVFNFPAGDTVASRFENSPSYYDFLVQQHGWKEVNTNKAVYGDIIYRPVDRRQNFVKRCVGLPGDVFGIKGDTIFVNGQARPFPANVQFSYLFSTSRPLSDGDLKDLDITPSDLQTVEPMTPSRTNLQPFLDKANLSDWAYIAPLTSAMIEKMKADGLMTDCIKFRFVAPYFGMGGYGDLLFPAGVADSWTLADYGGENGITIPAKGMTIDLTPENWLTYQRCIRNYEGHDAFLDEATGKVIIDGTPADTYTFAMDYYF